MPLPLYLFITWRKLWISMNSHTYEKIYKICRVIFPVAASKSTVEPAKLQTADPNIGPIKLEFPEGRTQESALSLVSSWNSQAPWNRRAEEEPPYTWKLHSKLDPGRVASLPPPLRLWVSHSQDHAGCDEAWCLQGESARIAAPAHCAGPGPLRSRGQEGIEQAKMLLKKVLMQ